MAVEDSKPLWPVWPLTVALLNPGGEDGCPPPPPRPPGLWEPAFAALLSASSRLAPATTANRNFS